MGQEIHRRGVISSEIRGKDVLVELVGGKFSVAMLQMHLQVDYPEASISDDIAWDGNNAKVVIAFATPEDAMHFHLRH